MELIGNGYFDSGELEPWSPCEGMSLEGGVTPDNPVFCSSHNLKLLGNDCVRQQLERAAVASESSLSLWVRWRPTSPFELVSAAEAGIFEACVEYSAGGATDVALLNLDALRARGAAMLNPLRLTVAVDPHQYVTGVRLRCFESEHPWYVAGVSMEGYYVGGGDEPSRKIGRRMDDRLHRVELRLAKLERFITMTMSAELRPSGSRPSPEQEGRSGKKSKY